MSGADRMTRRTGVAAAALVLVLGACSSGGTSSAETVIGITVTTVEHHDGPGDAQTGDAQAGDAGVGPEPDPGNGAGPTATTASTATTGATEQALVCDADRNAGGDASLATAVTVWHSLGGDQTFEVFDALVDDFRAAHPNIEIDALQVEGYASALRLIRDTDPADFPDLFMASVDTARLLAESGAFVPPSACWGEEPPVLHDLLPVIRSTVTVDEVLWSYPFNISTPVLIFDPTVLRDAGIADRSPPATPTELGDLVAAIAAAGEAPGGLALYDRSGSWLVEQWAVNHGHVLVEPANAVAGHPIEEVRFATDEAIAALEWARSLYDDGLVSWVSDNQSGLDDLLKLIDLADRAAFTMHTSAAIGDLVWLVYETGIADLEGAELGVAPLPTPTGESGALAGGGSLWLLDNGDPVATSAATHFAEFLMAPSSQASFAAATGYVPATEAAAAHPITVARWEEFPQFSVAYRQLADQGTTPSEVGMQIAPRVQVQRVLENAAKDVIVNGADAREALGAAERDALDIIRQYELGAPGAES
jgi:sn-glycerol 3-phosphate transport system substrate-binding protein